MKAQGTQQLRGGCRPVVSTRWVFLHQPVISYSYHDWTKWRSDLSFLRIIEHIILFKMDIISIRLGWWMVIGCIWWFKFSSLILIQRKWPITRWTLATIKVLLMELRLNLNISQWFDNDLIWTRWTQMSIMPIPENSLVCFSFAIGSWLRLFIIKFYFMYFQPSRNLTIKLRLYIILLALELFYYNLKCNLPQCG